MLHVIGLWLQTQPVPDERAHKVNEDWKETADNHDTCW